MSEPIALTLPVPPSINHYWRNFRGRTVVSADGREYKEKVAAICIRYQIPMLLDEVAVTVRIYRKARRGDIDNFMKVLLDSLRGYVYKDDSQIIQLHVYRFDDKANPRAEVEVKDMAWRLL